ncbi:erythromycin esterase family protein [Streptomyces triticisoli]|jgi:erythromycin esterase-like protein|uniref:erythromycin esterase family protein n=1 Tax=Streptomyces triticisoli TaxID=2182797 RepID=UPI000DD8FA25|nr:erythromycin esterase family protein [Streptomyces triticisoli]
MTAALEDVARAVDVDSVMGILRTRPRLLALGEPTHGEDALLEVRNDLFRQLVEQEGYRIVAIESDCMAGLIVDDYVTSGTGTLDDVMERGFSHGFGGSAANRELVRWMRAYNDGRSAAEQVRFAGFDGPLEMSGGESPRHALTALHAHLADRCDAAMLPCTAGTLDRLLGDDDRWTEPAAMTDPSRSVGRTPDAERLRLIADDLTALLDAQASDPDEPSARDDRERARLYARTATGLLRYHSWTADTSPGRLGWLLILRDSIMAANLLALAEQGPVLAHGHNGHLQRERSSMRRGDHRMEWWSAGGIVSARLGEDYAFVATALGTIRHRGVQTPPPDTVEGLLYALPEDRYVVDVRQLAATLGDAPLVPRESPWYGYSPLDPARLASKDALVFVKDAPEGPMWWPAG